MGDQLGEQLANHNHNYDDDYYDYYDNDSKVCDRPTSYANEKSEWCK
jgi:hypothetical protein